MSDSPAKEAVLPVPCDESAPARDTRRTQTLLAALMWTAVGIGLPSLGMVWMAAAYGWWALLAAVPFVAVGFAKGHFLLDRVAVRSVARIRDRGPCAPVWQFLSVRMWLVIALMMGTGQVLRLTPIPRAWIGFVYVAVGVALLLASRTLWRAVAAAGAGD